MANRDRWCFTWFVLRKSQVGRDRAALRRDAKWPPGAVISIAFLDGDPILQQRVKETALQWTAVGLARLRFEFRAAPPALVRISFQHQGSWSAIGTTCRQVTDQTEPTMNFDKLTKRSSQTELKRVVLHEFGHALGLVHEHQSPEAEIHWNRDRVFEDLSFRWSTDKIEENVFQAYAKKETNYTALDPRSIMNYPIPSSWTVDGFSLGLNRELSPIDKAFIHAQYP